MSKKLMLLAAGALTALAFAALPAVASAAEFEAHCSASATCSGTIAGGQAVLQDDSGGLAGKVTCTTTTGTTTQTSTSSTGTATLTFDHCTAGLGGECENEGVGTQKIVTNQLVSHLVIIHASPKVVGVLLTGINVTFTCHTFIGTVRKTVTGNIIGEITNPNCGVAKTSHTLTFAKTGPEPADPQKYMQVTTAGTKFDLTSGTHSPEPGSDSTTSSQTGTGTTSYTPAGTTVT